jgi:hypothetical protein
VTTIAAPSPPEGTDIMKHARRERRVLTRGSRFAWRFDQAERERTWALVSACAEGISIRTLATAIGLSPSRVHLAPAGPYRSRLSGWATRRALGR